MFQLNLLHRVILSLAKTALLSVAIFSTLSIQSSVHAQSRRQSTAVDFRAVGQRFGLTPAQARGVYALIDRNSAYIDQLARERGANRDALKAIARELGLRNPRADLKQFLRKIAERAASAAALERTVINLQRQVILLRESAVRTRADALLQRVKKAYTAGDLDGAAMALAELRDVRLGESDLANSLFEEAYASSRSLAVMRGDVDEVDRLANAFDAAMARRTIEQQRARWRNRYDQADARLTRGLLQADSVDLEAAINQFTDVVIPLAQRDQLQFEWSTSQLRLGSTYLVLAELQGSEFHFNQALACFSQALLGLDRETYPFEWGSSHQNKGAALLSLQIYRLGSNDLRSHEAIEHLELALQALTKETYPSSFALANLSLGSAYQRLGWRTDDPTHRALSRTAFEAALSVLKATEKPELWAIAQTQLILSQIDESSDQPDLQALNAAVQQALATIQMVDWKLSPFERASLQLSLADVLSQVAERTRDRAKLEQSVQMFRSALSKMPRDLGRHTMAGAQMQFGLALERLYSLDQNLGLLEEAANAYRMALSESSQKNSPLFTASLQWTLGNVLQDVALRSHDRAHHEQAIAAYRLARSVFTQELDETTWADLTSNLATSLEALGNQDNNLAYLNEALSLNEASLAVTPRKRWPVTWAALQGNIASVMIDLGHRESGVDRYEKAIVAAGLAQAVWKELGSEYRDGWAVTTRSIGIAQSSIATRTRNALLLREARANIELALGVFTRDRQAREWANTQHTLGDVLRIQYVAENDPQRLDEALTAYDNALLELKQESATVEWQRLTQLRQNVVVEAMRRRANLPKTKKIP